MKVRSFALAFTIFVFLSMLSFQMAFPNILVVAQPTWPGQWIQIDVDPNEDGPIDDWRDVEIAYYQQDVDYLYLKLHCYAMPGSEWPSKEGRYKWFIDLDGNMYHSGENIFDAEYVLIVEDTDDDGLGEMYLFYDTNADGNLAEYEPWPVPNYADFEISNSNIGGWRIVSPYQIEMYISWASIGDPVAYSLTWATDQENPNLDQGPATDHVDEEEPLEIRDVEAVSQTPNATNVMQGTPITIEVIVENQGMQIENFEVTCYFNMNIVGILNVTDLLIGQSATLYFDWNTTEVPPGIYIIEAWADSKSAIDEIDEANNWCTSPATVTIQGAPVQYYLTIISYYGITGGEGWYDNATNAYATLNTNTIDHGNGTRRVFTHWSGGASGANYASSDPIYMDQNKTAVANWKTQYYLTVTSAYGTLGGEGWYDSGTTAYASVSPLTVLGPAGTRYLFTYWSVDASGSSSPSDPIVMNGPKTAVANWKTQYYLTVTSGSGGVTNPSSSEWYDSGTTVSVLAIPNTHYLLDHWELDSANVGSSNPYNVTMNAAHTLHVVFVFSPPPVPTYYLTVGTDPSAVTSIAGEGWYDENDDVLLTTQEFVIISTGVRYRFTYWDIDEAPQGAGANQITVSMDANHTATAHYILQYYLTVNTVPSGIATILGGGWYVNGTEVELSAPFVMGYDFLFWNVDGASQGDGVKQITVTMNEPYTATAFYQKRSLIVGGKTVSLDSPLHSMWLSFNIVLAAGIILIASWRNRQREKAKLTA